MKRFQSTLNHEIILSGHGVHSAKPSTVKLKPASVNHGIIFVRHDDRGEAHRFPALNSYAGPTDLCTTLGDGDIRLETIEHLMAAISACGLDNIEIEASANELPILDGSSVCFMTAIKNAGHKPQDALRKYMRILKPVRVESESGFAEFVPAPTMCFDISIAFSTPAIGEQTIAFDLDEKFFEQNIAPARTFGFLKDAEKLRSMGLALGSSLENSLVIGYDNEIVNEGGKLFENEFVRHKALDAVGDTALLGYPFIGLFRSLRGGHALNAQAVKALLAQKDCYEIIEISA